MEDSELQLIQSAFSGEEQAQRQLDQRYRKRVFRFCYRQLGRTEDAEDATQETFMRAWRFHSAYNSLRSFWSWLIGIASNVCRDYGSRRLNMERRIRPILDADFVDPASLQETENVEFRVFVEQTAPHLRRCLLLLKDRDRRVAILLWFHDRRPEEIAQMLPMTRGYVDTLKHRILARLKHCLQQSGVFE
jgi:RNA polymerase sigma-70 factor (ECF subfamily)